MDRVDPLAELRGAVGSAAASLLEDDARPPRAALERPPRPELGDYSSNVAMLVAGGMRASPREVAESLREQVEQALGDALDRVEVAGPGFLNLHLDDRWYRSALARLVAAPAAARLPRGEGRERILVEFVSANPTGPLTAAGGRHAAFGDALARLLAAVGHEVSREYYFNDAGGQIDRFAASIAARMADRPPPEDGYEGAYVGELAAELRSEGVDPDDPAAVGRRATQVMIERIRATLERMGVGFDSWFSERALHEDGRLERTLALLREQGHAYESQGALWLRTTDFGDDKDRVLVRSSGEPTYFAADVAYHRDKLGRGFDRMINLLGADHHGYTARMRAAVAALGVEPERLEPLLMQFVHVVEGGGRAQMSKRKGEFVTLDELLSEIGADATRFFMLQRSHDTTIDLDLDLARRESSENPVYYVQYAHARIASILRKAGDGAAERARDARLEEVSAALEPAERDLIKRLLEFPDEVAQAAARRAPHRICAYATAVAADFHAFYRDCKVVGAEGPGVEAWRLAVCVATKDTVAATLGLLGIGAPERM